MARTGRKLGANIFTVMQRANISCENLAEQLGYTYRDICRLTEGRLWLPPVELARVAEKLNTTKEALMNQEEKQLLPELQYMKEFSNPDHLDLVLDLLDEYVELKESV